MNIILTGAAGFIGFHTTLALLKKKINVYGIDDLNPYYDVRLKKDRLAILKKYENFHFLKKKIEDKRIHSFLKKRYRCNNKFSCSSWGQTFIKESICLCGVKCVRASEHVRVSKKCRG